jgi:hypothetical protein
MDDDDACGDDAMHGSLLRATIPPSPPPHQQQQHNQQQQHQHYQQQAPDWLAVLKTCAHALEAGRAALVAAAWTRVDPRAGPALVAALNSGSSTAGGPSGDCGDCAVAVCGTNTSPAMTIQATPPLPAAATATLPVHDWLFWAQLGAAALARAVSMVGPAAGFDPRAHARMRLAQATECAQLARDLIGDPLDPGVRARAAMLTACVFLF